MLGTSFLSFSTQISTFQFYCLQVLSFGKELTGVNWQVLKSVAASADKFVSNHAKNLKRIQPDFEIKSLQKSQKPMTQQMSVWHFPIQCTLYPLFSFNPLPDDKILDESKLKKSADDNFEFDVNSRKFSKQVELENALSKEEIARQSNFSFSHSVFKRLVSEGRQKVSLCGNGLRTTSSSKLKKLSPLKSQ